MPIVFFVVIFIAISILSAKAQANKTGAEKRAQDAERTVRTQAQRPAANGAPVLRSPSYSAHNSPAASENRRAATVRPQRTDVEELTEEAKKLAQDARRIAEAITGKRYDGQATTAAQKAKPVSKPAKPSGKPIMQDDDCGGGSIHDGYHEGVSADPFGEHKPRAAVAGNLGKKLGEESEKVKAEQLQKSNAQRAIARISTLPPMAQGIVFSEILGKPKAELS